MGPATAGSVGPVPGLPRRPAATDALGTDVTPDGSGIVDAQRTYQLIRQPGAIAERRFEIEFLEAGVEAYCFTFG